ncbi:MAG: DUF4446 family protein [Patescibacteria group bacterium]
MEIVSEYTLMVLNLIRYEPILSGLAVLLLYSLIRTSLLSRRLTKLTKGGDGKTLEGTIKKLGDRTTALETHAKTTEVALENVDERLQGAVRGVAVERFDPFGNSGQQSFATALLNEKGDGVVLSGIHSRDGVRVYAKEIKQFKSERELSEEEAKAVAHSQKTLA